jgi:hypothetical protein
MTPVTDIISTTTPVATPATRWIQKIVERTMQTFFEVGKPAYRTLNGVANRSHFVWRKKKKKGKKGDRFIFLPERKGGQIYFFA